MTSTRFNVGLGESARPSSKVLKPPGGGHTDIFGAVPAPVKKDMGRNASSILEGKSTTEVPASPTKPSPTSSVPAVTQPAPQQSSQRVKVPPGGFSSGLW